MELAGLEPATSWVRSGPAAGPPSGRIARHAGRSGVSRGRAPSSKMPSDAGGSRSIRAILPNARGIVLPMANELDLTIVYEPGEDGWIVASIPEVAGVFSQGRTRDEARQNVIDALRLMLSPEPRADDDRREREPLHLTIAA